MISDKTAYRRYLDGEEKAADLLVERYGDALTLYINGYIKDIHEAEDLMIEAFSQLFAKWVPLCIACRFLAPVRTPVFPSTHTTIRKGRFGQFRRTFSKNVAPIRNFSLNTSPDALCFFGYSYIMYRVEYYPCGGAV